MSYTYLALDPGKTTGVAWYNTETGAFGSLEIEGRYELYAYLAREWGLGSHDPDAYLDYPDHLVVEDWRVRGDTHRFSRQDDPHRIIGAIDFISDRDRIPMRLQTPAQAKRFSTNDKLRALGWFSGGEGHADDAARHLLVALVTDQIHPILERVT